MTLRTPWIALCLLVLAGCADMLAPGTRGPDEAGTQGTQQQVRSAAATLLEGFRRYDNGRFQEAIAVLNTPEMQAAPAPIRVEALKYTAFSYCVTEDYARCRHAFDLAFAIDAGFDLRNSERGHPMWGPVFDAAQAASAQDREHASLDHDRERWRGIDLWRAR